MPIVRICFCLFLSFMYVMGYSCHAIESPLAKEKGNLSDEFQDNKKKDYYAPIPRDELRASRDIFFYQRGDTLYYLFDPTDSLQYIIPEYNTIGWYSRPMTESEKRAGRLLDAVEDLDLVLICNIDTKTKPRIVTRQFVENKRPVTREELVAFFHREKRRRIEAYKRTGNIEYECYSFYFCTRSPYFFVHYVFVPMDDGNYKMYKVR